MQKGEYLHLSLSISSSDAEIRSNDAVLVERTKKPVSIHSYPEKLGDEGWELVAMDSLNFYFRRPNE